MESLLCCPVCTAPLDREAKVYTCPNRHGFDRAKEGYVHLLPANQMHSRNPGDDREMAAARTRFLSGGYYAPLLRALETLTLTHTRQAPAVLDSGCGEGYYTAGLYETLSTAGRGPRMVGVDLSKMALRRAARRVHEVEFAVASVYHLPVAARSVDLVLNCFSPLALDQFRRVLKPGGTFLYVVPAAEHLWQLKQVLYDHPYRNPEENIPYEGFSYETVVPVETVLQVPGPDLMDLFHMTPYCWKTPKAGIERLTALDGLTVKAAFRIHVFRRGED
ncbi:MAG: methyltransferase domain-containing protein [Intestinimonas sp.]|nr:methyltransferase domain-containing protein [Intestinimonas sp.]